MPPQETPPRPSEPTTRLESPVAIPPHRENTMGQPAVPPQPTTQIKPPVMSLPSVPPVAASVMPPAPPSPPPTSIQSSSARAPLFWSLVGVVATIVVIGIGFYLYGMFLSGSTTAPTPEAAEPVVRACGSDVSCLASAVTACTPARGTVSVDEALSFVVARSVFDVAVTGAKNDLSCGVLITQNSASAALPDSFFESAKIPEEERGAVI
ncbi:MAG: hypothetical protein HYW27_00005 [Candidatus Aenigmarchaeota archaeon]|nr:hypothetical protein [Candidatus Aenigmarchaeota archaeon]